MPLRAVFEGVDLLGTVERLSIPSYAIDRQRIIRRVKSAARALAGDVAGRHFTDVVAPAYRGRAREQFLRKLHGKDATSCARSAPTPGSKRSQWRAATA